jgi:Predicted transmembrane transcriptional regulator (anti-sigma factor)
MDRCFDEGTIQAFLDGELASDMAEKVACHVAVCDECAAALAVAEEESSFAFAALDTEINVLVPTERIRTRLFETISAEKKTFWQRIFGKGFSWTSAHVAAFASLVFVVTAFAVLFSIRENSVEPQLATVGETPKNTNPQIPSIPVSNPAVETPSTAQNTENEEVQPFTPPVQRVVYQPKNETRAAAQKIAYKPGRTSGSPKTADFDIPRAPVSEYAIAGEETYIRTIEMLNKAVEQRKDELMRPSVRVAFEKDLAVVNDAIEKMRREIRKNPRNEAAREVLRASYQNKIDLLNSVAERNDMMAVLD